MKIIKYSSFIFIFSILMLILQPLFSKENKEVLKISPSPVTLKIGIKESEPWVIFDESKDPLKVDPQGFSIDLWKEIAKGMEVETEWVYFNSLPDLLEATKNGEVDASISAITINWEREQYLDFSNSMYETGLRIFSLTPQLSPLSLVLNITSILFGQQGVLIAITSLIIFSHIIWLANKVDQGILFEYEYRKGIFTAIRWSIMLVVAKTLFPSSGYSWWLAIIWRLNGRAFFIVLTGLITASLASNSIGGTIENVGDLHGRTVAVVKGQAPQLFMKNIDCILIETQTFEEGIQLVLENKVEAMVHDGSRLHYWSDKINTQKNTNITKVSENFFDPQNYGIALPQESQYTEAINQQLLRIRENNESDGSSFYKSLMIKWLPRKT